jgi:hypothetical protein
MLWVIDEVLCSVASSDHDQAFSAPETTQHYREAGNDDGFKRARVRTAPNASSDAHVRGSTTCITRSYYYSQRTYLRIIAALSYRSDLACTDTHPIHTILYHALELRYSCQPFPHGGLTYYNGVPRISDT